jgi:hypothetical protein
MYVCVYVRMFVGFCLVDLVVQPGVYWRVMCNMGIRERGRYFNVNGMTPSVSDCDRPWYMYFNLNSICLLPNIYCRPSTTA